MIRTVYHVYQCEDFVWYNNKRLRKKVCELIFYIPVVKKNVDSGIEHSFILASGDINICLPS